MADSTLRQRLRRLFSTSVIVRNIGGTKLKVADISDIQRASLGYVNDRYMRLYGGMRPYMIDQGQTVFAQRLNLFKDYEAMDQDPIIASALELYAEEATVKNEWGDILTIVSDDKDIKAVLENLFYDILNIEFNLFHWVRNLVKYGDMFLKLNLAEKIGIVNVIPISPYFIERLEGFNIDNPYEVMYKIEGPILKGNYENYEISHFRMLSDSNFLPYGKSMVEQARRIWKQLILMEDAMLIHRIIRAPQKRIFQIDVGNLSPDDVKIYMQSISDQVKKVPYMDEQTGQYNLKYNIQNIVEDFYLPTRGGDSSTKIDTLPGLEYNAIEDVEYLRNKMMSALRIPKAFLGYEEQIGSKATLSQEDIRFARTVERIQKIIAAELENLAYLHLYLQGYDDQDLSNFEIKLSSPSTIFEQEKLEIWKSKFDLATTAKDQQLVGSEFIYKEVFKFTDDEIKTRKEQVVDDTKFEYRLSQIKEQGNDPTVSGQHADDGGTVRKVDEPDQIDVAGDDIADEEDGAAPVGRPEEADKTSYGTDEHELGRDPVGKTDIKNAGKLSKAEKSGKTNFKGGSPFSLESKQRFSKIPKQFIADKHKKKIIKEDDEMLNGSLKDVINDDEN